MCWVVCDTIQNGSVEYAPKPESELLPFIRNTESLLKPCDRSCGRILLFLVSMNPNK